MKTVFVSELKPFLDAVAGQMELYVPKETGGHYVYRRYDPSAAEPVVLNNIRTCATVKEFLFPMCELAAVFPAPAEPLQVKPFAVFGLKDCDLRSIEILDKVFQEEDFKDPLYIERRRNMFIISSDCWDPAENCFCNLFDGRPFAEKGFDLNVSRIRDGFIIETGSMRQAYAEVAGGENPRKVLGDRVKHRLMHKFVYFLDRYGLDMCVGCGRCIDTCAGGMDTRTLLKKLNEELKSKKEAKAAK